MAGTENFVGRAPEIAEALIAISRGKQVLIQGRTGIGKTALMRVLYAQIRAGADGFEAVIWFPHASTKAAFESLARQLHEAVGLRIESERLPPKTLARARASGYLPWDELTRTIRRMTMPELARLFERSLRGRKVLVFLEALEVPPSQAEFFRMLIDAAQVVAAIDPKNRRARIEKLLWKFNAHIELKGLPLEASRELVAQQLRALPVRFSDPGTEVRFIQAVAQDSGGVPEAILGMLEAAAAEDEITPARVRSFHHDAAKRYFDMTPVVLLAMLGFIALRYVSRGLDEQELWVWAGIGSTLFLAGRMLYGVLRMR